jgi:hypothetical protein
MESTIVRRKAFSWLPFATVFCAGMAVGGFLLAYTDQPPLPMAVNDIAAQTSQPGLPTAR